MTELAGKLMEAYAIALDLPEDWIKTTITKPVVMGRLAYYPSPLQEQNEDQLIFIVINS